MDWTPDTVEALLSELRAHGRNFEDVEVKLGAGGVPDLGRTLCAFGNMPNGGTVIVGLDEKDGFAVVGVPRPGEMEQGIAATARQAVVPAVQVSFEEAEIDGATLVIASVAPLPSHQRPCRYKGEAWLRQSDGDYQMSDLEVSQLIAVRERPRYDAAPVEATSETDLDPSLVSVFVTGARAASRRLASEPEATVLQRKTVVAPGSSLLTVAGLYALGAYPQQFLPNLSITAAVQLDPRSGQRTRDLVHLDGPLPDLLDAAVEWVRRNTLTTTRFGDDGHGRDEPELPMVAVRELIANALVHRDLGPHTRNQRVEIRLTADDLIITNPGGLYGVSLKQLGTETGKSAVNEFLYDVCKLVRTPSGHRIIEGEGGGIREVQRSLRAANMRPPRFIDAGVRFTVIVPRHSLLAPADIAWLTTHDPTSSLSSIQQQIVASMRHGQVWTNALVRDEFAPIDSREATSALQGLVNMGLASVRGEKGRTEYLVDPGIRSADDGARQPVIVVKPSATDNVREQDEPLVSETKAPSVPANAARIVAELKGGPLTLRDLVTATGLSRRQVTYSLAQLREAELVDLQGGPGRRDTVYSLRPGGRP